MTGKEPRDIGRKERRTYGIAYYNIYTGEEKACIIIMTSKEINFQRIYRLNHLKEKLKEIFEVREIRAEKFFYSSNGKYFRPILFQRFGAIVLEYDDLEDGDLFYLDELTDEELLENVIREIEM